MLFFWTFSSFINPKVKQHNCFQHYYNKKYIAANHHSRMISEESCDTEDWSINAENTAVQHSNTLLFNIFYNNKPF